MALFRVRCQRIGANPLRLRRCGLGAIGCPTIPSWGDIGAWGTSPWGPSRCSQRRGGVDGAASRPWHRGASASAHRAILRGLFSHSAAIDGHRGGRCLRGVRLGCGRGVCCLCGARNLGRHSLARRCEPSFRNGLPSGEPARHEGRVRGGFFGLGCHRAARHRSAAARQAVVASGSTRLLAAAHLPGWGLFPLLGSFTG